MAAKANCSRRKMD